MTRVTVGVPVYNGATLIERALQNLADQTCRDIRVVIMDNASTDGTGEIARCLVGRLLHFKLRRRTDRRGHLTELVHGPRGCSWRKHSAVHVKSLSCAATGAHASVLRVTFGSADPGVIERRISWLR